ncbi:MAG: PAS domain-containing protein, partial [Verrucomicrobiota bacterium]
MKIMLSFDRTVHAALWAGALVIACGLSVLAGWLFEIDTLRTVLPGFVAMKANTAICFILSGISLAAGTMTSSVDRRDSALGNLSLWSAILVIVVAGMTEVQYVSGLDFGIDEALFQDIIYTTSAYHAGRMSPITAFNFLCLGSALMLLARRRAAMWVQALAIIPAFIILGVVVGTSYGIASLQVHGRSTAVAVHASAAFIVLCVGVVCASGREGVMRLLTDQGTAGKMVRRICPAAILVPSALGYLRIWGERHQLFDTESGVALFSVLNIVAFSGLVWWNAHRLSRNEAETRRASGALQESLDRYIFLADAMPQIVWSAGRDGSVEYLNKGGCSYAGISLQEASDWGWGKMIHPEDLPATIERWRSSLALGEVLETECRIRHVSDGLYRWHIVRATPQRNDVGEIILWVGTCTDIDDYKRAEAALRESEQRLHLVFDNLSEGLFISDTDGRLLHWNKAGLAIHGLHSIGEGLRNHVEFYQIFELSTLDGKVLTLNEWPLPRVLRGEQLNDFEVRLRRIGTDWERIFRVGGSMVHDGCGKPMAFITFTDITERKQGQMTA